MIQRKISWTAEFAYAVGLITTDGSLSKDGRHITLTSSDHILLEIFNKCLRKHSKISVNPPGSLSKKISFHTQFSDKAFFTWLLNIGLTPNKTLRIGSLKVPDTFLADYLRGHLDGDGSIISYIDKYNQQLNPKYIYHRLFVYFISASRSHIEWLRKKINQQMSLRGSLAKIEPKNNLGKNPLWRLKFSTREAKILLRLIYYKPNLPCLPRKYELVINSLQPF